jgi:hypothetical protein
MARASPHVALALAKGCGRLPRSHPSLPAAHAGFLHALHYHAPLGGYRCLAAERSPVVQIAEVCLRVKVYGGLHGGRVLELPDTAREGDYITLPIDLPDGEMFGRGRSNPERHQSERSYRLVESAVSHEKYLSCVADSPRFITSVTVPPVPSRGITINL